MPYAPQISYDTQSFAQGINQGGQNLAAGLREMQANKLMATQAIGRFEAALAANPEIMAALESEKAPEHALSAYSALKKGGVIPVQKAALLAQFADTFTQQKGEAQKQQVQKIQLQMAQAQQAEAERIKQFNELARKFGTGNTAGVSPQLANNPFFQINSEMQAAGLDRPDSDTLVKAYTAKMAKPDKETPKEVSLPSGAKVAFSPSTGAFSVLPQTPEQIANAEAARTEAETTGKAATAFLTDLTDSAETARHTIGTVDRIVELYKKGAESGAWQTTITQARSALNRFGLGKGMETQQQFEQELGKLVLEFRKEVSKGTGSVSNFETAGIDRAMANPNMTPGAVLAIIGVLRQAAERAVKLDELRSKLEDEGKSNVEIAKAIRRMRDQMPLNVDSLADLPTNETPAPKQGETPFSHLSTEDIKKRLEELQKK